MQVVGNHERLSPQPCSYPLSTCTANLELEDLSKASNRPALPCHTEVVHSFCILSKAAYASRYVCSYRHASLLAWKVDDASYQIRRCTGFRDEALPQPASCLRGSKLVQQRDLPPHSSTEPPPPIPSSALAGLSVHAPCSAHTHPIPKPFLQYSLPVVTVSEMA